MNIDKYETRKLCGLIYDDPNAIKTKRSMRQTNQEIHNNLIIFLLKNR